MKNQYFGDVNDYRKYGLLRALQSGGDYSLLVAWMLTPDDGGTDGRFRSYLAQPDKWRQFDSDLYGGLTTMLGPNVKPQVSLLEESGLLPRSKYFSALVPDQRSGRVDWQLHLVSCATGADLVFFDPDNGIEVPSRPVDRKGSSKYVTWEEIRKVWETGCSLLIYQHFPREPRRAFAERMLSELRDRTGAAFTEAIQTSNVLFLLAAQARHEARFHETLAGDLCRWKGQIDVLGFSAEVRY